MAARDGQADPRPPRVHKRIKLDSTRGRKVLVREEQKEMSALFWVAVGVIVGWHVPQPTWATVAFDKVRGWFKS